MFTGQGWAEGTVLRVALTGGIGSGKSTVADLFADLGTTVIDADRVAHALTAQGQPILAEIEARLGPGLVDASGILDRAALRRMVFADPARRALLEQLLHPPIRERMRAEVAASPGPYAVLVIPLLFETGQMDLADRILVVDLPESEQIRRVCARSRLTEAEIQPILAAQVPRTVRLGRADDLIDNSGPPEDLYPAVLDLHRRYLDLASRHGTQATTAIP